MSSASKRTFIVLMLAVSVINGAAGFARADFIYIDDVNNKLGILNTATGVVSNVITVTHTGGDVLSDIAFNSSGVLYGVTGSGSGSNLYTINTTTGVGTLVGNIGVDAINALTFGANGTLYAASNSTTDIYKLNLTNGHATSLGSDTFTSSGDLAFNNGNLYLSANTSSVNDHLIRVKLNGNNVNGGVDIGNIGFAMVHGLVTGSDGVLYGATGTQVVSINTGDGQGTVAWDFSTSGLSNARGAAILLTPEPGSTALILSGSLALGVGYWRRRRGLRLA